MLILPIVNQGKVFNVQISLKNARKVQSKTRFQDAKESEVIVNGKKFSDSSFNNDQVVDFIRFNSLNTPRNYLVTTRNFQDQEYYDLYEVGLPPSKVNDSLDSLYLNAITDMRKEVPNKNRKGYYVSLDQLGFNEYLTDDKIDKLKSIVASVRNTESWPVLFEQAGITDVISTIGFLNQFDCTVVPGSTIEENYLKGLLDSFEKIHSRDYKQLNRYYNIAKDNHNVYKKLSRVYSSMYNEPYRLIQSQKQKAKTYKKTKNYNHNNAA